MQDKVRDEIVEDLEEAEKLCIHMADLPDIWQNRVVLVLCRLQYRSLKRELRRHINGHV